MSPVVARPPAVRAAIIWTLLDQGFPRADAEAWADGTCHHAPAYIASQAIAFDDHGIPLHQALEWHDYEFDATEACCFYDHGYTPEQATNLWVLAADDHDIDDWLATGLPADKVIAYLQAGVTTSEVPAFEAADPDGDTLPFLAALLG